MRQRAYISDQVIILDPDGTGSCALVKSCGHCGEPFTPTEAKHSYCSKRCQRRHKESRRKRRRDAGVGSHPERVCGECGGEIVWDPRHGERCDACLAAVPEERGHG